MKNGQKGRLLVTLTPQARPQCLQVASQSSYGPAKWVCPYLHPILQMKKLRPREITRQ